MENMLSIGAKVDQASVKTIGELILKVLATTTGDNVKIAAVNAVASSLKVEHVNVTNCTFTGK